ncbi:outer membrane lipoprotein carrier protein LolA [Bartonella sp. HY329]|uniref:outer membrane lipoprotein carrier protein LolA n=1 Tax=unclassified Bartonella TaxID=2645622 RepID=UPI0021CA1A15|nr:MULTISPECIES: outer membrane lipoprotein carrier protein LolA [unclassified Bartonella]UXM96323.1 outer membrane lipoprotein carrier protein LolA [Bartonella sp. HY329]UXN10648.1 outer membrane lipoprotein carrier protein LolA [Bartonella sp. HY328]
MSQAGNRQEASNQAAAQKIADHFAAINTMTGDFIQFSPKGKMTEGTFYLERPGKIRFVYKNSPIRIISDGKSVVINNKKLDSWDLYQLSQTPMKLLLDTQIDLSGGKLLNFVSDKNAATMELTDKTMSGGKLRLIFDVKTNELKQWTMIDRQNLETTVQITNLRSNVRFADGMFRINYQNIAMKKPEK